MPGAPTAITAPHAPARTALLLIIPLTLAAMVYHPITRVYFFADDLSTLAMAASDSPVAFVLPPFGGHLDVTRNLVFLTSYRLFGMRAELFYWTVLLTHLLNVWLLFRVLRRLTASDVLACFGATVCSCSWSRTIGSTAAPCASSSATRTSWRSTAPGRARGWRTCSCAG
jgi:hypothetical protein